MPIQPVSANSLTIYITWLMNNTGSRLPLILFVHWSYNMVNVGLLPITTVIPAYLIFILAVVFGLLRLNGTERLALAAILVVVQYGYRTLTG